MSILRCECCAIEEVPHCVFVVVFTRYDGRWLFSRHRRRDTWETQGGHVEPGETPGQAARRELYEESGAVPDALTPVCGYWADRDGSTRYGIVYFAEAARLDPLPASEIAEVRAFDSLPDALTYPEITPKLFDRVQQIRRRLAP